MTDIFAAFAAIMSLINFVALSAIHYNLSGGYYRTRRPNGGPAVPNGERK